MIKYYQKYLTTDYCSRCGSKEVFEIPPGIVKCAKCLSLERTFKNLKKKNYGKKIKKKT